MPLEAEEMSAFSIEEQVPFVGDNTLWHEGEMDLQYCNLQYESLLNAAFETPSYESAWNIGKSVFDDRSDDVSQDSNSKVRELQKDAGFFLSCDCQLCRHTVSDYTHCWEPEFRLSDSQHTIPIWSSDYPRQRTEEVQRVVKEGRSHHPATEQHSPVMWAMWTYLFRFPKNKSAELKSTSPMYHCPGKNGEFRGCKCDPETKREDDRRHFVQLQVKPILKVTESDSWGSVRGGAPRQNPFGTRGIIAHMQNYPPWRCDKSLIKLSLPGKQQSRQSETSFNYSQIVDLKLKKMYTTESATRINNHLQCDADDDDMRSFVDRDSNKELQNPKTAAKSVECNSDLKPFSHSDDRDVHAYGKNSEKAFVDKSFLFKVSRQKDEENEMSELDNVGSFICQTFFIPVLEEKINEILYLHQLIQDFMSQLFLQFINILDKFNVHSHADWLSGKACFLYKLEESCRIAFMQKGAKSRAKAIASALHIVNALSLYEFETLTIEHDICPNNREAMLFTCFLLKNKQFACALSATSVKKELWYDTKCDILRNYLWSLARDTKFTKTKQNCVILVSCAMAIGDDLLVKRINAKLIETQCATKTCSSYARKEKTEHAYIEMVVADGNIYDRARDPPGQRSVYIPPGDSFKESYRLSTFIKYPQEVPVNPRHLASAGFLYTGYKDRVKCFSCGLCCENWVYGDDVRSAQWHRSDCAFMRGGDSGNVPIGGGGLARFMAPPKTRDGNMAMDTGSPASNFTSSSGTAKQVQPTSHQPSAGSLLLSSAANQSVPMQTARPVQRNQSVFQIVEFATIPSAYHENFLKNLDLRKESERLRTFEHWPSETPTVYPADLAKSGFFYLGNLDRVQCFSCGGVLRNWNYGDNVQSEHRRHFPHCKLVQGAEPRNVSLTPDERAAVPSQQMVFHEPPDPSENEARDLRNMFQCQFPVSPHMRNEDTRFETFDHRWPSAQINATPRQIARAGFFFLGDRDRVKCWYCNGGLQNWDQQDEPWTEHAKWFPTCEFLLQRKGPDFVHRMVSMFPNLPRPLLRGPFDVPPANPGRRIQYGTASARAPSPPPPIIDPQAELQREQQKVRDAMNSDIVKAALEMGFERKVVKHVVKRRIRRSEMCTTVAELVDDVTGNNSDVSDSDDDETPQQTGTSAKIPGTGSQPKSVLGSAVQPPATSLSAAGTSTPTSMETEETSPSMQARIQELQEERKCKICLDNIADIVFVPCGHLCSCGRCAEALRRCPMCRMKIEKAIRTYMS